MVHVRSFYQSLNKQIWPVCCCSITPYWAACLQTSTTSSCRPFRPVLSHNRYRLCLCQATACMSIFSSALHTVLALGQLYVWCRSNSCDISLCCDCQLEQFNMIETPISSDSLYSQTSTLNYSQALMMGLTGGHCNLQDSQQLGYSSHGNIPNIILTGASLTYHVARLSLTASGL